MAGGDKMHLRSKEGDLFDISSDAARLSEFLVNVEDIGTDGKPVLLQNVTKSTLTKVVSYMEYHVARPPAEISRPIRHRNLAANDVCRWDREFLRVELDVAESGRL